MRIANYFVNRIPVKCHIFNKKAVRLEPSSELTKKFDNYFHLIDSIVEKENKDEEFNNQKEQLNRDYRLIKELVVSEIRQSGDKKSVYTDQLLEFLLISIYKLIDGLGISQKDAGAIFDLKPNDFGKIGIFPDRCQRSYNKETDFFLPIEHEQDTIKAICEFINKEVLTNYACRGVIALTNTPAIFVNLASGDNKIHAMTIPEPEINENGVLLNAKDFNYAFARYLFYNGNQLEDKDGNKITFGNVKKKISDLLNLNDVEISVPFIEYLLQSDIDMSKLVKDGDIPAFDSKRQVLKDTYEDIDIYQDRIDAAINGYIGSEDYYENGYDIDEYNKRVLEGRPLVTEDYDTYSKRILQEAVRRKDVLLADIRQNLDINKIIKEDNLELLGYLIQTISKKLEETVLLDDMSEDNLLLATASYFITEYFENGVCLSAYREIKEYLESKKITDFIDAIGYSGVNVLSSNDSIVEWLGMIDDNTRIKDKRGMKILNESIKASKDIRTDEPVFLYVDTSAYSITQNDVNEILDKFNLCVVIRGSQSFERLRSFNITEDVQLSTNYKEG